MSNSFFNVEMLPAKQGDALWIQYGNGKTIRRILIDGGPIGAFKSISDKLDGLPEGCKGIELIVISHVDTDHIEGMIRLLGIKRSNWPILPKDIWFNGWRHLKESGTLGGREGDFLSALIQQRADNEWNRAFNREAVVIKPSRPLPVIELKDGMKLTLLSPTTEKLQEMADKWSKDVERYGFKPGDIDKAWEQLVDMKKFHVEEGVLGGEDDLSRRLLNQLKIDQSVANGTSIAFLAEFEGKSCLFLADAHMDVICESLRRLNSNQVKPLKVDAVKMSHHGSRHNISEDFMRLIDAKHYLISTNSSMHQHPDEVTIETIINWSHQKPTLWFNYRTDHILHLIENQKNNKDKFEYRFPDTEDGGIIINL